MAYTITNTDGTILTMVADGTVDRISTSLTLVGKNYSGYGQYFNENFVTILANSANTSSNPPRSPLNGQIWYDTTYKKLRVYDSVIGFRAIGGATVSATSPGGSSGDLWYDTINGQFNVNTGTGYTLVGPLVSQVHKSTGLVTADTTGTVIHGNGNSQEVALIKNHGYTAGIVSNNSFTMDATDYQKYIYNTKFTTTSTVVQGLNLYSTATVGGLGFNNTSTISSTPSNTSAIVKWLSINVNGDTYYTPLYQ